jgi:hypothetical protein
VVVARPQTGLAAEAVIAHCRGHLADYKCQAAADLVAALLRNATGMLKGVLRKPYWQGRARGVG